MFLFSFYNNNDLFITIYLCGLVFSIILFGLSVMFDSKKIFFLFITATISSIALNINTIPADLVVIFFLTTIFLSKKFEGGLKNKVFLNIMSLLIVIILTISGIFSVLHFIESGDTSSQTFLKQEIPTKL